MNAALARPLDDLRRLHLQHGPIDLVIEAFGPASEILRAYAQAEECFHQILPDLAGQIDILRRPARPDLAVEGAIAGQMLKAVLPHARSFITPMAAVAGAVADHVLHAMLEGRDLTRAYVNNGGDIALFLSPGTSFRVGIVSNLETAALDGFAVICAEQPIRGIATSGAGGRSFSLGIADSVTVLAKDAATADAAATMIANAVDLPGHPAILRQPAVDLQPDSDLGRLRVTVAVGKLSQEECRDAVINGLWRARALVEQGIIEAAKIALRGAVQTIGGGHFLSGRAMSELIG